MPGVPSGKGCDACRRQKKKCDQAKPACSRCARLNIRCVGGGQQRYKFMGQDPAAADSSAGVPFSTRSSPTSASPPSSSSALTLAGPARSTRRRTERKAAPLFPVERIFFLNEPLSNGTSRINDRLVHILQVSDVRYDIRCYGQFIQLVPPRLGKNEALDAASDALTASYPYLSQAVDSAHALATYGKALRALRQSLTKPDEYVSVETLCAIYMIMLCQVWLGNSSDNPVSHGQGLAHILAAIGEKGIDTLDPFGVSLFNTLCFMVSLESVFDKRVNLPPEVWNHLKGQRDFYDKMTGTDSRLHYWSLSPYNFQIMFQYMRQPEDYEHEFRPNYERLLGDVDRAFANLIWSQEKTTTSAEFNFCLTQASVLTACAFMFNGILKAIEIDNLVLVNDYNKLFEKMELLGQHSLELRPLGSSHMLACIISAKSSTDDVDKNRRSWELFQLFAKDFASSSIVFQSDFLKAKLASLRRMAEQRRAVTRSREDEPWIGLSEGSEGSQLDTFHRPFSDSSCTVM